MHGFQWATVGIISWMMPYGNGISFCQGVSWMEAEHCFLQCVHDIIEPSCGKTNNVVSEQVRHKPACTSTEKS